MKLLQIIKEEVVPLSRRQSTVLLIIIACIFQFVLFYAPALADQAVKEANAQVNDQETIISNESMVKDTVMDAEAAKLSEQATTTPVTVATTTPMAATTTAPLMVTVTATTTATTTPAKTLKVVRTSTHTMTAYNSEAAQTDDSPCITANGFNLCEHGIEDTIAANFLPMGTKVRIPDLFGDRIFIVRDRMNQRHATRVDVWMKNRTAALKFGIKVAKIEVLE